VKGAALPSQSSVLSPQSFDKLRFVLKREIGLWRGVALNMIDMVGIGPFITIPFILKAMGGGRAMLAWVLGGLLAISDGLVTAELSSELPAAGGSYHFLRNAYGRAGRVISFLFLFQILFSAPLSMASGCIGFANYLAVLVPGAANSIKLTAMCVCVLTTLLLLRRIGDIGKFSILLWIGVMLTLAIVILAGLPHLKLSAFTFWNAPRSDNEPLYAGLGAALIFAVYDYLGYYNICYLGDEVHEPEKTIPRVIVISILAIGVIYLVMNACIISVLPMQQAMSSTSVVSDYIAVLLSNRWAKVVSVLILWTAFASIFSLMLGYSRILYAAARDNNFFHLQQAARNEVLPLRLHSLPRRRRDDLLQHHAEERAASDPVDPRHHPVHGADRRRGHPARSRAGAPASIPHVALPPAGDRRPRAVDIRSRLARERDSRRRTVRHRRGTALLRRARNADQVFSRSIHCMTRGGAYVANRCSSAADVSSIIAAPRISGRMKRSRTA